MSNDHKINLLERTSLLTRIPLFSFFSDFLSHLVSIYSQRLFLFTEYNVLSPSSSRRTRSLFCSSRLLCALLALSRGTSGLKDTTFAIPSQLWNKFLWSFCLLAQKDWNKCARRAPTTTCSKSIRWISLKLLRNVRYMYYMIFSKFKRDLTETIPVPQKKANWESVHIDTSWKGFDRFLRKSRSSSQNISYQELPVIFEVWQTEHEQRRLHGPVYEEVCTTLLKIEQWCSIRPHWKALKRRKAMSKQSSAKWRCCLQKKGFREEFLNFVLN